MEDITTEQVENILDESITTEDIARILRWLEKEPAPYNSLLAEIQRTWDMDAKEELAQLLDMDENSGMNFVNREQ